MTKNPKKILVVDDDKGVLTAVSTALQMQGYDVTATSDEEYFESLKFFKNMPDLIVLDMLLSGADGREICMKLKSHKSTAHIPIIMFTAASNAMRSIKKAKADAFLPKPFSIKDLVRKIEDLV